MISNTVAETEETRMIRKTIENIAQEYDHAYWRECAREDRFPQELWDALADGGFHGIGVPDAYGGVDLGVREFEIVVKTLARHGVSSRMYILSSIMGAVPLCKHGSEDLKERILPEIATGETKLCFAITEPEAGTNSFKISTRAERDGDEYIVNGQKTWTSGASDADYIQLVARTTPYRDVGEDRREGGTLMLVPTDADGVELNRLDVDITEAIGEYSVYLDDVRVPVENRVGEEGRGFFHVFDSLNPERIALTGKVLGYGEFVLERAVDYATERVVFDDPIGSYQGIQHPLAEAKIQLELANLANQEAIAAFEADDEMAGTWANIANYAGSEAADAAFDIALQSHGGNGFSRDYDIVTLQNNIRLYRIAPINNEMLLNFVGEHVLGLPKSY